MDKKSLFVVILALLNVALGAIIAGYRTDVLELNAKIAALEVQVSSEKHRSVTNEERPSVNSSSAPSSLAVPEIGGDAIQMKEAANEVNHVAKRSAEWKAQFYLSEVDKLVALTPQQKEALRNRYSQAFSTSESKPPQLYRELLRDTLGDEIALQLERAQHEEETKREEEALSDEIFSLSRKLGLSKSQEVSVTEAMRAVRDELRPLDRQVQVAMREAMSNHSGADPDKDRLRASYDQLKELSREMKRSKNEALSQRLKGILTEAQYNALLEAQATEREPF